MSEAPALRACAPAMGLGVAGPSSGALRVIPSRVPGMEIDTATWRSSASSGDNSVDYRVQLHSTADSLDTDVALLYVLRAPGGAQTLAMDDVLHIEGGPEGRSLVRDGRAQVKGEPLHIITYGALSSGLLSGPWSSQHTCPVAVRLIPRNDLAMYGLPGADASDTHDQLIARALSLPPTADTGALRLRAVLGSFVPGTIGMRGSALGVLAENTTGSVLANRVVALVVEGVAPDTFEFVFARIEPRQVITRTGRSPRSGGMVAAVTYPADRVLGRTAGGAVMAKPRINKVVLLVLQRDQNAGLPVELRVTAYDTTRGTPGDHFDLPARWSASSATANVSLTDTTNRGATLYAEHAGVARVSVTVGGVTASKDVTFDTDPRSTTGPVGYEVTRRVLADGSIQYLNQRDAPRETNASMQAYMLALRHLCTIRPNGTVKYATWLRPWAARHRADTRNPDLPTTFVPDSARLLLAQLKECRV